MSYSPQARALRRCSATCRDGTGCLNYAVWSDTRQRCGSHGGRVQHRHVREKTAYIPCRCEAYAWPHRPGSGYCEWPDEPTERNAMRRGTHNPERRSLRLFLGSQPTVLAVARACRPSRWPPRRRWS
jgi:hypothetical protein